MNSARKTALVAGLFYLISFVSIPTLLLYTAVHEPNFIVGPGPDTPVLIGGVLEMIVALAGLGSAVALYPILKRQNQSMALGLVGTRTIEGAVIVVGVVGKCWRQRLLLPGRYLVPRHARSGQRRCYKPAPGGGELGRIGGGWGERCRSCGRRSGEDPAWRPRTS